MIANGDIKRRNQTSSHCKLSQEISSINIPIDFSRLSCLVLYFHNKQILNGNNREKFNNFVKCTILTSKARNMIKFLLQIVVFCSNSHLLFDIKHNGIQTAEIKPR